MQSRYVEIPFTSLCRYFQFLTEKLGIVLANHLHYGGFSGIVMFSKEHSDWVMPVGCVFDAGSNNVLNRMGLSESSWHQPIRLPIFYELDKKNIWSSPYYLPKYSFHRHNTSCATVIVSQDGKSILFGKVSLNNKYDLPKGRKEQGESYMLAAIRELREETGLDLSQEKYRSLAKAYLYNLPYNADKNISLFFLHDLKNELLNPASLYSLKCSTYFDAESTMPEMSEYTLLSVKSLLNNPRYAKRKLTKSMWRIFQLPQVRDILTAMQTAKA